MKFKVNEMAKQRKEEARKHLVEPEKPHVFPLAVCTSKSHLLTGKPGTTFPIHDETQFARLEAEGMAVRVESKEGKTVMAAFAAAATEAKKKAAKEDRAFSLRGGSK